MRLLTHAGRSASRPFSLRSSRLRAAAVGLSLIAVTAWASASPALAQPASAAPAPAQSSSGSAVPPVDHIFVIMEENNGFHDVIGNKAAPNLNYLARTFGLETDYFGAVSYTHLTLPTN